ncbi:MAG: hypothetical protein A3H93_13645 [Rhodocyclales bacterium RIFCSPLOWO2_02_FULL_63_24]|nr:MAG: hypothetical protein A3H93_13645 [Rhodocyclales bacterium RIFCSPLOWO2_02_FULL_63_24]
MGLFLWLIILLGIAWSLADFQLRARIEDDIPPPTATRPAPATASSPEASNPPDAPSSVTQAQSSDSTDTPTESAPTRVVQTDGRQPPPSGQAQDD